MDANKTVTANFAPTRTLTLSANPGGGGTTNPSVGTHDYGDGVVVGITATPASGYQFVNWTGDVANPNSASTTVTMNANKTVTANFVLSRTLTMAVSPSGGGTTNPAIGDHNYADGTVVSLTATPAAGYQFTGWTGDVASSGSASTTVTMSSNRTVTANFSAIPDQSILTISVSPSGGGTTSPTVGTHAYDNGAVVTIMATPAAGYQFVNWTGDVANPNDASTTVTMSANKTVTANFTLITRTLAIAVSPSGGGMTDPAAGSHAYDHGTVVNITATPASGFQFTGWTGDVTSPGSAATTVTMDADKNITANFSVIPIRSNLIIVANPPEGGSTDPAAGLHTYDNGTVVSVAATPSPGFQFVNWTGDVADPNSIATSVTINGDKTVIANFRGIDAVDDGYDANQPGSFDLSQNYPNPFNPSTTIMFRLPKTENVTVAVYNSGGQRIRVLAEGTWSAGSHETVWDGKDSAGNSVGSGIYYCRMTAGAFSKVMKMIYMR